MTDSLITATDDTAAAQQDAPQTVEVQGDPAQAAPQEVAADTPAPEATPEPQDFDIAIPEGVEANADVLAEFKGIAKELNLSPEAAQKLADLQIKMTLQQSEDMRAQHVAWAEASKTDKEFGGDAFDANLSAAKTAMDAFASPELKSLLNVTGLGNHPEVIRAFVRIGKQISEDGSIVRGSKADSPSDPAKRLFPNHA